MTVSKQKEILRQQFRSRRALVDEASRIRQTAQIAAFFHDKIKIVAPKIIAGFWPVKGEVDVLPLLRGLLQQGSRTALPAVSQCEEALAFYNWDEATPMKISGFGIPEPVAEAASVWPDIVLVPLLAFDRQGHRLGYGRGMYDRFLRHLKGKKSVITIGVGFEEQECADLPHDANDQRLDWILTGREALAFKG